MSYATASEIAKALGGKRGSNARHWMARCPAHDDKTPSFSITDAGQGRPLVFCFSGCDQRHVIAALRDLGLWASQEGRTDAGRPLGLTYRPRDVKDASDARKTAEAKAIWDAGLPFRGTLVEAYLRSRRIKVLIPHLDRILRFVPSLKYTGGGSFPAMVAAIHDGAGRFTAVQRTYLSPDGGKAPVDKPKKGKGPQYDGAVRLAPVGETLGLAEGIETALSALEIYSTPTWAVLSAVRLKAVTPPKSVRRIIIFADAGAAGTEAAYKAQEHYEDQGYEVEVILPGAHFGAVGDFNDALKTMAA